jgi:superfamily II DNA helicase RecQ
MPFEFIQIPANGQGSAKEELNKLLRGGRIASVRKEFVPNGEDSFWAFCIEFLDGVLGTDKTRGGSGPKVDYKEVLSAEDFAVFSKLRDLRKALSEKEAIPAYSIFTNEQLAAMVTGKVDSQAALAKIEGIGAARIEKYGAAFLAALKNVARASGPEPLTPARMPS